MKRGNLLSRRKNDTPHISSSRERTNISLLKRRRNGYILHYFMIFSFLYVCVFIYKRVTTSITEFDEKISKPFEIHLMDNLSGLTPKRNAFLYRNGIDGVYDCLLGLGHNLKNIHGNPMHIMEVGMHSVKQCIGAAKLGFEAHCVEPSPQSIPRIMQAILKADIGTQERIRLYQMAAGEKSGDTLKFTSSGGTGDHVGGNIDVWNMTRLPSTSASTNQVVDVKSISIDDIIYRNIIPTTTFGSRKETNNNGVTDYSRRMSKE